MGNFENAFDAVNKPIQAAMSATVLATEKMVASADKTGQPANGKAAEEVVNKSKEYNKEQEKK